MQVIRLENLANLRFIDLIGRVVAVNQQIRQGEAKAPKLGDRRRLPMTVSSARNL